MKWPSFKVSSNSTGYSYTFRNAKTFSYEPGLEVYSLTFYEAEVLDFSNSCTLGYLSAYRAFDLNLSGITFKNANFGYAPRCERCVFPNNIESDVNISRTQSYSKDSISETAICSPTVILNDLEI